MAVTAANALMRESGTLSPLGNSPSMHSLRELISQVAPHDTLALILGESGTGKEVVARSVHASSSRADRAFVPVNCGAIPADLLESELFGHEKGAFTGAVSTRKGRFEMAEGGTLFLDEIGDMSLTMQVKLLRVLQEKCFERVGSNKTIHCDVRIVAATHRDLAGMIEDGSFRHDLYFRLNVFPITLPALREHPDDLPVLVTHFFRKLKQRGLNAVELTDSAMKQLGRYEWPGNIRELENLLERLAITHAGKKIRARDLPPNMAAGAPEEIERDIAEEDAAIAAEERAALFEDLPAAPAPQSDTANVMIPAAGFNLKGYLAELEQAFIEQALNETSGTVTRAAELLGLQRTTLAEKMKKFGMIADR